MSARIRTEFPESTLVFGSMKPFREIFHPARSIRARIGFAVGGVALIAAALLSGFIGNRIANQLQEDKGATMARLAYRMIMELDQDVEGHLLQMSDLAKEDEIRDARVGPAQKRALLEMLKRLEGEFAWIGVADANGMIVAGTGGLLEGKDVSQRVLFYPGQQGPLRR